MVVKKKKNIKQIDLTNLSVKKINIDKVKKAAEEVKKAVEREERLYGRSEFAL